MFTNIDIATGLALMMIMWVLAMCVATIFVADVTTPSYEIVIDDDDNAWLVDVDENVWYLID